MKYPVKLTRDTNDTILVTFPDVPEAITFGDDEQEALLRASDALEAALAMYVDDHRHIPQSSSVKRGMRAVSLPALSEAKINLYRAMRQAGVTKAELARRLKCHLPQVDRLLDLDHASRLDQLESAFLAIGKKLTMAVEDAA
jgi:antitoxin HicB